MLKYISRDLQSYSEDARPVGPHAHLHTPRAHAFSMPCRATVPCRSRRLLRKRCQSRIRAPFPHPAFGSRANHIDMCDGDVALKGGAAGRSECERRRVDGDGARCEPVGVGFAWLLPLGLPVLVVLVARA